MITRDTLPRFSAKNSELVSKWVKQEQAKEKAKSTVGFFEKLLNYVKTAIAKFSTKEVSPVIETSPKPDANIILNNNIELQKDIKEILGDLEYDKKNCYTSTAGTHQRSMESLVSKTLEKIVKDPTERQNLAKQYVERQFKGSQSKNTSVLEERVSIVADSYKSLSQNNDTSTKPVCLTPTANVAAIKTPQVTTTLSAQTPDSREAIAKKTKFKR